MHAVFMGTTTASPNGGGSDAALQSGGVWETSWIDKLDIDKLDDRQAGWGTRLDTTSHNAGMTITADCCMQGDARLTYDMLCSTAALLETSSLWQINII